MLQDASEVQRSRPPDQDNQAHRSPGRGRCVTTGTRNALDHEIRGQEMRLWAYGDSTNGEYSLKKFRSEWRGGSEFGTASQSLQERSEPAVRIPREFEFSAAEAVMRKEGDRLIIEPAPPKSLLRLLATLSPLDEDFPPILDLAPVPSPSFEL